MARFITLAKLDGRGKMASQELSDVFDKLKDAMAADASGGVVEMYSTLGAFDLVVISEADTAERAAAFARAVSEVTGGTVTTLTAVEPKATDDALARVSAELGRPGVGRPGVGRGTRSGG
jgi:uncharacterized protein with GYD domain